MNTSGHIRYIPRQDIDLQKWDDCIARAPNGLIYGRSYYLDHMTAGQWDALVWEDYAAVMPLTWKKRAGIRYLYQPPFTQQLGVFFNIVPPPSLVADFLAALNTHFRFAEIFLNHDNPHPSLQPCPNYILSLDVPYTQLSGRYKEDLAKNLKRAARFSFQYLPEFDLSTALALYKQQYQHRTPHIKEDAYTRFSNLCFFLKPAGQILVRAVTDDRQQPLAIALLLRQATRLSQTDLLQQIGQVQQTDRMHLLQSTVLPVGRQTEANHFLIDNLIREFADTPMILDFEGSSLPGIAHFYRNFGAGDQPYFFHRHNRLPWPLRLFKN